MFNVTSSLYFVKISECMSEGNLARIKGFAAMIKSSDQHLLPHQSQSEKLSLVSEHNSFFFPPRQIVQFQVIIFVFASNSQK